MGIWEDFDTKRPINRNIADDTTIEYSEYYLKLIKKYKDEIAFIDKLYKDYRQEVTDFFSNYEKIKTVLDEDKVKPEVQEAWLEDFRICMKKSFDITEKLITTFVVKKLDEFKREVLEKTDK